MPDPFLAVCSFFDEGIGFRGMRKLDRRRRANFDFVKEGQFQKEAEVARIRVCHLTYLAHGRCASTVTTTVACPACGTCAWAVTDIAVCLACGICARAVADVTACITNLSMAGVSQWHSHCKHARLTQDHA